MELKDQLSWTEFLKYSKKNETITSVLPFNRLVAHTQNFFIISGYGAFTEGYLLIITKDFIPSFGLINKNLYEELEFLIKIVKYHIKKKYKKNSVIFEHGMCACIGGLDRAHLHVMSIDKNTTKNTLKDSINKVLYKRKVGINFVEYNKYKLENIHDINQILDSENKKNYKINGKISKINNIKNLPTNKWPFITLNHIKKGGHYVFLKTDFDSASFLTTSNFQTQFGREVIYENEIITNNKFKKKIRLLQKENIHIELWKWQNSMFEKNIIDTINHARKEMKKYKKKFLKEFELYNFDIV